MSWKLTGHPKTQPITTALAKKFAEMDPAPDDRPLSEARMMVYRKLINDGVFRPVQWAMAYCKETGGTYRINGKHTSTLMAGMNPLPDGLYAVVEIYECDDLRDVSRLYSTYDSKLQSRTVSDINRSFAACVNELSGVHKRVIDRVPSAVWYSRMQEGMKSLTPQERAEALLEHSDFAVWLDKLVESTGVRCGHMRRMPVVAAIFATYQKAPRLALEFWTAVRDETGPKPDLPDRKLARWLILNSSNVSGSRAAGARYRVKDREFFVKCLHAWNAWREDAKTNLQYHAQAPIPAVK